MIYKFKCGFCKFEGTRKSLRKHLSQFHLRKEFFNSKIIDKDKGVSKLGSTYKKELM